MYHGIYTNSVFHRRNLTNLQECQELVCFFTEIVMEDLQYCRLCTSEHNLTDMDGLVLNYVQNVFSIAIHNDELSKEICETCKDCILIQIEFKDEVDRVQKLLQKILKSVINNVHIDVTNEVMDKHLTAKTALPVKKSRKSGKTADSTDVENNAHIDVTSKVMDNINNIPKRPLTAYIIWFHETREKIKSDYPGISFINTAKKAGEIWKKMTSDDKEPFIRKANKLKEEYNKGMKAYIESDGASSSGNREKSEKRESKKSNSEARVSPVKPGTGSKYVDLCNIVIDDDDTSSNSGTEKKKLKIESSTKGKWESKKSESKSGRSSDSASESESGEGKSSKKDKRRRESSDEENPTKKKKNESESEDEEEESDDSTLTSEDEEKESDESTLTSDEDVSSFLNTVWYT